MLVIEPYSEDEGEAPEPRTRDMLVFDNIEFANDADISLYIDIIKEYVEALPYDFINMGLGYNNIDDRYFEDMDVISKETGIKFMRLGEIPSEYDSVSYMDDIDDIYTDYESGFKDGYVVLKRCGKCFINLDVDLNDQTENDDYDRNIQEIFLRYNERDALLQESIQRIEDTVMGIEQVNDEDELGEQILLSSI